MVYDTTFSFIFGNENCCEATNISKWKMLPQTFIRVLSMCATYYLTAFKVIQVTIISISDLRMILGGRQNSSDGAPSSGENAWQDQNLPESKGFRMTNTAGSLGDMVTTFDKFTTNSFFFFWLLHMACRILVPQPGIETVPHCGGSKSLTTEPAGKSVSIDS